MHIFITFILINSFDGIIFSGGANVDSKWYGEQPLEKQSTEADLRNKFGVNVVAIKVGNEVIAPPAPNQKINASDILVLVGKIKGISALENLD